jgi:hypothetical protein
VEGEREGNESLGGDGEEGWPSSEARSKDRGLDMPAKGGRDQVKRAVGVEATAENAAGDAVQRREIPGDLRAVNSEMRRDWAVQALLDEDLVVQRSAGCCSGSGEPIGRSTSD